MKAICISACEVKGFGIITPGEEIVLPDGFAKDPRINQHFVIDRQTIKDENASVPDIDGENEARRTKFAESLVNNTDLMTAVNVLMDEGIELPNEVVEGGLVTDDERIERIVGMWVDNFGYVFPTDPKEDQPAKEKTKAKAVARKKPAADYSELETDKTAEADLFG